MKEKLFLITSPLFYTNAAPHLGHLYSILYADFLHRYKQGVGFKSFFLAGLDQHGQKIFNAAIKNNEKPEIFVKKESEKFISLWKKFNISYTHFVETDSNQHKIFVKENFNLLKEQNNIVLKDYEGFYCVFCETFQFEDNQCVFCKRNIKSLKEKNYFFKVSETDELKVKELVESWSKKNTTSFKFVHQLRDFWRKENFDLSISRPNLEWGVDLDEKGQKAYVWFDALLGYLSVFSKNEKKQIWNNKNCEIVQVLGKEIMKFHLIYWPLFLQKLRFRLPDTFLVHGWILTKNEKMSKSKKNAIRPEDFLEKFDVDVVRLYLASLMNFNKDIEFSQEELNNFYEEFVVNNLSNFHYRIFSMYKKYREKISLEGEPFWKKEINLWVLQYQGFFGSFEIKKAIDIIFQVLAFGNQKIDQLKPWSLFSQQKYSELSQVMFSLFAILKLLADLLSPFSSNISSRIYKDLQIQEAQKIFYKILTSMKPNLHFVYLYERK